MFGLRQKLAFGFGGLLLILLVVSALGIAVLKQHRTALDKFLYENWRSVEYGQNMIDALERVTDAAKVAAKDGASDVELNKARSAAAAARAAFDVNLEAENRNITLPGEERLAGELSALWRGDAGYKATSVKVMDPSTAAPARSAAYEDLLKRSPRVKAAAQAIGRLNLDKMKPIDGR